MNFEETILRNILNNAEYRDRVMPFLEENYFEDRTDKMLFNEIHKFMADYKTPPSRESLAIIVSDRGDLHEEAYNEALSKIKTITTTKNSEQSLDWLIDKTEKYCQERAIVIAIEESLEILDGKDTKREKTIIPQMLKDALGVSFKARQGHDYFKDYEERLEHYISDKVHIPCDLHMLNVIMNGGACGGTLNVPLADTGVGKSIMLCHLSTSYLQQGKNVVYFTMEMGEHALGQRIDANLLDMPMDDFRSNMHTDLYRKRMETMRSKYSGELRVVEFGAGQGHAGHFRQVMDEFELKDNWKTDVIMVDYLSICSSEHWKPNALRHDLYLQKIAEELRNLGKERDIPVWAPHQTNRDAADSLDVGKKNTSDSYGIIRTVDLMFAIMSNDDLASRRQVMIKQIKNRYGPEDRPRTFLLGLDKSKMRFYNLDSQQHEMVEQARESLKDRMEENQREVSIQSEGIRFN